MVDASDYLQYDGVMGLPARAATNVLPCHAANSDTQTTEHEIQNTKHEPQDARGTEEGLRVHWSLELVKGSLINSSY